MKRLLVIGAVAVAALSTTGTIAYAAGSAGSGAQNANQRHPAARRVTPAAAIDSAVESKFTAIAPCRALDTRASGGGGAFANGAQRSYNLGARCSVPGAATAVAATITTVATHGGYLKAWAYGASEPATSFMNYGTAFNASTGGVIPVGGSSITVKNHAGPTQVIIDITGYYIKPMYAYVASAGTLNFARSSRATGATHLNTGTYQVDFDRNVASCDYQVTTDGNTTSAYVEPRSADVNGVFVETYAGSTLTDSNFYVSVTC